MTAGEYNLGQHLVYSITRCPQVRLLSNKRAAVHTHEEAGREGELTLMYWGQVGCLEVQAGGPESSLPEEAAQSSALAGKSP